MAAPVELFTTSILSNHKVRSRHERFTSVLAVKKIPFVYHDLASDEDAKSRWRRKAKDPQIPGLLVHNEWRGTFEEFEEAVEFGELDIFLRIDPARAEREAAAFRATSASPNDADVSVASSTSAADSSFVGESKDAQASTSKSSVKVPAAPSVQLVMAPAGSGKRADESIDDMLADMGLGDLTISDADASTLLDETDAEAERSRSSIRNETGSTSASALPTSRIDPKDSRPDTSPSILRGSIGRTYVPSPDAGTKPLRLARMGSAEPLTRSHERQISGSSSPSTHARYSASQRSTKALAAEAEALATTRKVSASSVRTALASGQELQDALGSEASRNAGLVGHEDADDLFASLGLGDVEMTEEEAEAFLTDGKIPDGLHSEGDRITSTGRNVSKADKARNHIAAMEVARKAREAGYLPRASLDRKTGPEKVQPNGGEAPKSVPESVAEEAVEPSQEEKEVGAASAEALAADKEAAPGGDRETETTEENSEGRAEASTKSQEAPKGEEVPGASVIREEPSSGLALPSALDLSGKSSAAPAIATAEAHPDIPGAEGSGDSHVRQEGGNQEKSETVPWSDSAEVKPTEEAPSSLSLEEDVAVASHPSEAVLEASGESEKVTDSIAQAVVVPTEGPETSQSSLPASPSAIRSAHSSTITAHPTAVSEEEDLASLMATAAIASGDAPALPDDAEVLIPSSPPIAPSTPPPRTSSSQLQSDPTLTASPILPLSEPAIRVSNGDSAGRSSTASAREAHTRKASGSSGKGGVKKPSLSNLTAHSDDLEEDPISPSRRALDYKRAEFKDLDLGPVSPPLRSASSGSWTDHSGDAPKRKRVLDGVKSFVSKSKDKDREREREKSTSSSLSAASSTGTSVRSGHQRTISDILREADAAMNEDLDDGEDSE